MVLTASNGGYTATPHQRQNRRRERPGSRTRRSITRKAALQSEFSEGLIDAFDLDVQLPSDRSNPSPLLRQNFDNAWQKWKAREAEQRLEREECKRDLEADLEKEQLRLFGGEVDDDELRRLGILFEEDRPDLRKSSSTLSSWTVPAQISYPLFTMRQVKSKRLRRRTVWQALPLNLSLSNLRNDYDLARLLSSDLYSASDIHRNCPSPVPPNTEALVAQSLPKSSPSSSALVSLSTSGVNEFSVSLPQSSLPPPSFTHEDWTFITPTTSQAPTHPSIDSTPFSEPETWILLGDDL